MYCIYCFLLLDHAIANNKKRRDSHNARQIDPHYQWRGNGTFIGNPQDELFDDVPHDNVQSNNLSSYNNNNNRQQQKQNNMNQNQNNNQYQEVLSPSQVFRTFFSETPPPPTNPNHSSFFLKILKIYLVKERNWLGWLVVVERKIEKLALENFYSSFS